MNAAASPLVRCERVGMRFANGTEALAGLDFAVFPGDFLCLLGPSGCGKSTALRLIAGLAVPTTGTVERRFTAGPEYATGSAPDVRSIAHTKERRRGLRSQDRPLGYVFQEPTLMPWATVEANIGLPLRLAKVPRDEIRRQTADLLTRLGLAGFATAYPRELSGGMKMRVSIARALAARPRLLLLDEPFAALDEITRWKLNDDLLALCRDDGLTVVFVTHSVYESAYLANRIAVLSSRPGRIVAEIAVDAPYPRGTGYRTSAAFLATCHAVSTALAAAIHATAEATG